MVAMLPATQYTLAASALFFSIMDESEAVVNVLAAWNIHTALDTFKASRVTYDAPPIDSIPVFEQYTPEVRVSPDSSPVVKTCLHVLVVAAL